ncbi:MAG TPA: MraY family glycosyltransferase [Gaiellaceae bacterium]|nr:MraY family glycosyltransferase [Gaiellaceae bacterium]
MLDTFTSHLEILWGAVLALVIVVLLTPAVGGMARLLGVVDRPGGRRVNRRPVPRLGGIALFLGFVVPALLFLDLNREARGLLVGAAVATVVGVVDDFRGLAWFEKLGGQLAAAAIPVAFGIWVTRFTFPVLGIHQLPKPLGMTLTVLGIVAIMNMLNFLDGLDGLAAGVAAIAGFTFCVIALSLGRPETALVSAIVFGACLGFLRHNFYPARIFMGDSGALLLGFVLATEAVQGLLKTAALATLVLPLLVLAVPILDTSFVIAKRLKYRRPVWTGDRTHLHHRFVNIGFSQRRAVSYLYAWCATLAGAALATRFLRPRPHGVWHLWPTVGAVLVALAALGASVYIAYLLEIVKLANPRIRRREEEAREAAGHHRRSA